MRNKLGLLLLFILLFQSFVFAAEGISENQINDTFLHKYLPEYPKATIFRIDYLDFFSAEWPDEKEAAIYYKNQYVIVGDFNKNSLTEVAIAGLTSKKPVNNRYEAFILILEKQTQDYKRLYFKIHSKTINPNKNTGEQITNVALNQQSNGISITFKNETGFIGLVNWDGKKYAFSWFEEEE